MASAASPLAWPLAYCWPVNRIGPSFQPAQPPIEPTLVLLRREIDGRIHFSALSPLLFRLLELVGANAGSNGRQLMQQLASEAGQADFDGFLAAATPMLQRLHGEGVLPARASLSQRCSSALFSGSPGRRAMQPRPASRRILAQHCRARRPSPQSQSGIGAIAFPPLDFAQGSP